jgi:ribosomal protein S18 acetylase RimI-like enzyme
VCDVLEPWAHGTVARARRHPDYWHFNVVRVEDDPGMTAAQLTALADTALAGLAHRRLDFDDATAAAPLRRQLEDAGWRTMRLLWLLHGGATAAPPPAGGIEEVPYDAVAPLRVAWHQEDFPGVPVAGYHEQARAVTLLRPTRVLADFDAGTPIAFAQLEQHGDDAEITQVYVHPAHRGRGVGTRLTRAAIAAGTGGGDLWICADDEDRPKHLYMRLGFEPVTTSVEFTLPPPANA